MVAPSSPDVVPPPDFIRSWQLAESIDQVAKELGMTKAACRTRAHRYRGLGVPLKELKSPPLLVWNWEYLAQFAEDVLDGCEEGNAPDEAAMPGDGQLDAAEADAAAFNELAAKT